MAPLMRGCLVVSLLAHMLEETLLIYPMRLSLQIEPDPLECVVLVYFLLSISFNG